MKTSASRACWPVDDPRRAGHRSGDGWRRASEPQYALAWILRSDHRHATPAKRSATPVEQQETLLGSQRRERIGLRRTPRRHETGDQSRARQQEAHDSEDDGVARPDVDEKTGGEPPGAGRAERAKRQSQRREHDAATEREPGDGGGSRTEGGRMPNSCRRWAVACDTTRRVLPWRAAGPGSSTNVICCYHSTRGILVWNLLLPGVSRPGR